MRRKNIIVYFSDQQRWDTLTPDVTPNLMQLAAEGVQFENNYTCQPVCGPARACLQTGVYATQNGCFRNGVALPRDRITLAEHFNAAGYDTAYFGKWHLASDPFPHIGVHCEATAVPRERQGGYCYWRAADVLERTSHGYGGYVFDENGQKLTFEGYRADAINDYALEYLDRQDPQKPFFIFISQLEPHHQNDRRHVEGFGPTVENFREYPIPEDLAFLKGDYREQYPDYLSAVNRLDHNVGRLTEKLKQMGIYEDTVIIYTSDHGCHFRTRNMEYKRSCHDACIHTPLIIRGGDFSGGIRETRLTSLIDLPPTLLSVAGIPVPEDYMGLDVGRLLRDPQIQIPDVFIQISEASNSRAIRTGRYTYAVRDPSPWGFARRASAVYLEDYLYDNKADPCQKTNLVKDPALKGVREELRAQLKARMRQAGENSPLLLPAVKVKRK